MTRTSPCGQVSGDSDQRKARIVATQKVREIAAEQPYRGLHDGFEDRLHISRRLVDYAQNLCARGLTILRGAKLALQPRHTGSGIAGFRLAGLRGA